MPTLYIIRGLPGSGKSTLARKLVQPHCHFEADMFFMKDGTYCFDRELLYKAHEWCQESTYKSLNDGEGEDVAVSNTFIRKWEVAPYLTMASDADYVVQLIACSGGWENQHGVPREVIDRMQSHWEDIDIMTDSTPNLKQSLQQGNRRALLP